VLEYARSNPFHGFLLTVGAGAAFGCAAFLADAIWNLAVLGQRVRGVPTQQLIRGAVPFFNVASVSLLWTTVWLLTTDDPAREPTRRLRAGVLRLLTSALFLVVSGWMLGLFGDTRRLRGSVFTAIQVTEVIAGALLWLHVRWLAARLEFRGLPIRAVIAMLGNVAVSAYFVLGPRLMVEYAGSGYGYSVAFRNLRDAMLVLWAAIGALVMARVSIDAFLAARAERHASSDDWVTAVSV
jgi:hypothetical protein